MDFESIHLLHQSLLLNIKDQNSAIYNILSVEKMSWVKLPYEIFFKYSNYHSSQCSPGTPYSLLHLGQPNLVPVTVMHMFNFLNIFIIGTRHIHKVWSLQWKPYTWFLMSKHPSAGFNIDTAGCGVCSYKAKGPSMLAIYVGLGNKCCSGGR